MIELPDTPTGPPPPFPRLFSPLVIGPLVLRNRLVLSPMTTGFGFDQGAPTGDFVAYLAARSRGVGLTVVAFGAVRPEGRVEQQVPWMWRPGAAEALAVIPAALRDVGAVPCIQLGHGGRQVSPRVIGRAPVAPSPVPPRVHVTEPPVPLRTEEVDEIIAAFGTAAAVAADAGFEAVELHAAHGYLVHQFLSADADRRTDRFGGSTVAERARFGIEVIEAIHAAAPGLAVLARINGADHVLDGLTAAEAAEAAARFAHAGAHAIVVSGGVYGSVPYTIPLLDDPDGTFLDGAETVRAAVDVPVVAVGRIATPELAEAALASGRCDAVAVGRALLADPDWVEKARVGATADIRPCIATVQGCAGALQHGDPISCTVNPDVGRELRPPIAVAPGEQRRVLVVGGGPAGMEAARRAAELGHRVRLVEAEDSLGGALLLAARTPPLAHFARLLTWFEHQLDALGVEVELGAGLGGPPAGMSAFDDVIVAVGAATHVPVLDGYEHLACWTVEDLLAGRPSTFDTTEPPASVVVAGAGERGLATALWLAGVGREVAVVSNGPVGADTSGLARRAFLARLAQARVTLLRGTVSSLAPGGVIVELDGGTTETVSAEAFVLAGDQRSLPSPVAGGLRVGDGRSPRGMGTAIAEGRDAAERLVGRAVSVG